jgi:hypothetical protein
LENEIIRTTKLAEPAWPPFAKCGRIVAAFVSYTVGR